jgi:hypothetical protein
MRYVEIPPYDMSRELGRRGEMGDEQCSYRDLRGSYVYTYIATKPPGPFLRRVHVMQFRSDCAVRH